MRSLNSNTVRNFWIAALCFYAATIILWYIYEGHEFLFPPEAMVYDAEITLTPLLTAGWWNYACLGLLVVAGSLSLTAFLLRARNS